MQKINKKTLVIFILAAIIAFALGLALLSGQEQERESYLIPREGPKENQRRQLDIESAKGETIVKNIYDGYQIKISKDWQYEDVVDPIGGFVAYKLREGVVTDIYRGLDDGVSLIIHAINNPEKMSAADWLVFSEGPASYSLDSLTFDTVEHVNEKGVHKSTRRISEFEASGGNDLPDGDFTPQDLSEALIDGAKVDYVFSRDDKIYIVSCAISGSDYTELLNECEESAQSFKILDKDPLSEYLPFASDNFKIERVGINENTGDAKYAITLKPQSNPGDEEFKKEIDTLVERVNSWINSKGVDPKDLSIEWVTE